MRSGVRQRVERMAAATGTAIRGERDAVADSFVRPAAKGKRERIMVGCGLVFMVQNKFGIF